MDIAVDIDVQLATLEALATPPPAIVRPYFDKDTNYHNLFKKLDREYKASLKSFASWVSERKIHRDSIVKFFKDHSEKISKHHINLLIHSAEILEKKAKFNALELKNHKNQMKTLLKDVTIHAGRSESRKLKPIIVASNNQLEEEIDIYLEAALLLRGLAGKYDPDQEVVFTAKSSEDIDKFFESLN